MNYYDIYLKSGHVVQVKSKSTLDELMLNIWEAPDERQLLIEFAYSNVVIVKSHISAIKDRTKENEMYTELGKALVEPYKPWEEQKTDAINLEGRGTITVNKKK
jgi:hypothetical protein